MCNIPNIPTAIQEFARIIKHNGHLIIADPGISKKASDITFYCYLASQNYNPLDYLSETIISDINNFLCHQGINEDEYLATTLHQHGLNLEEYEVLLNTAYSKKRKQRREIQKMMADRQREFIKTLAEQNGLTIIDERYILSQTNDNIWETSEVQAVKIKPSMAQSIQTTVLIFKK